MRVLLFGGAGYIGSHVALSFLKRGDEVGIFDNFSTGLKSNIYKGTKVYEGDILDRDAVRNALEDGKWDAVVHLAAYKAAGESMIIPDKYAEKNISGSLILISECVRANVMNFILSSSAAVYGSPKYLPVDEKHPTNPENYYGYTKLAIEENLKWFENLKGLKYAALRYFNAAGYDVNNEMTGLENNPANLIPIIMEAAAGLRDHVEIFGTDYDTKDGSGIRDYVHVSDLATAHVMACDYLIKNNKSLVVNLGSEEGLSVKEIIDECKKVSKVDFKVKDAPRRAGDPGTLIASSDLARKELSWIPKYSDKNTIIASTWNLYKKIKK